MVWKSFKYNIIFYTVNENLCWKMKMLCLSDDDNFKIVWGHIWYLDWSKGLIIPQYFCKNICPMKKYHSSKKFFFLNLSYSIYDLQCWNYTFNAWHAITKKSTLIVISWNAFNIFFSHQSPSTDWHSKQSFLNALKKGWNICTKKNTTFKF